MTTWIDDAPAELSVLIVDDNPDDAALYMRLLRHGQPWPVTVHHCLLGEEALNWLSHAPTAPDCILLDQLLPDMTGLEFLSEHVMSSAVVLLTGVHNEQVAIDALKAGAQDYLSKGTLSAQQLQQSVQRAVEKFRLRQELDVSRQRMDAVLSSLDDAVMALNLDGRLVYVNEEAERQLSVQVDTPLPQWLRDSTLHATVTSVLQSGARETLEFSDPSGRWFDGRVLPSPGGVTVVLRDVTRSRQERERLRLLESVAVSAQDAVVISEANPTMQPGPRVVYVNQAFTRLTGYTPEDIIGRTPRILQGPGSDRAVLDRIRDRLQRWRKVNETILNYRKDGTPMWVNLSIVPVADESGWYTHWVSVQRDVTADVRRGQFEDARRNVLELASAGRPIEDVFDGLCQLITVMFPNRPPIAWVRQDQHLTLASCSGSLPEDVRDYFTRTRHTVPLTGPISDMLATLKAGRPVIVGDVATVWTAKDAASAELLLRSGIQSIWHYPVRSVDGQRLLGLIVLYGQQPGTPSVSDERSIMEILDFAARLLERHEAQQQLHHLALYDTLTGLPNRALYLEHLNRSLADTHPSIGSAQLAVGLLDLNRFKNVNDTLGHTAGDDLLKQVGARLRGALRPADVVARMGGDEFTLLLPFTHRAPFEAGIRQLIGDVFREPFLVAGHLLFVSCSLGLAFATTRSESADLLLSQADMAMYDAKRAGQLLSVFDPEKTHPQPGISLEADLHTALARGEFELHYQGIYRAGTREPAAAEALLRWRHPARGLISPADFIPLTESTGLIVPIGAWALREACGHAARWQATHPGLRVNVNLSARQFWVPDLAQHVTDALHASGLDPALLTLEITESVLLDVPSATETLSRLHGLGVRLSLDDFGTGYSSLSYLHRLPLHGLKIDRSFVRDLGDMNSAAAKIVRAIIVLAHTLNLHVTVEGLEQDAQVTCVEDATGDYLQGFFLARPLPCAGFEQQVLGWPTPTQLPGTLPRHAPHPAE